MASIIKSNTYADFNGREILTTDNNGALTTQKTNYPAFLVFDGDQNIPNAAVTKLEFNSKTFDTDSAFDTTDYRFLVPAGKAGKYYFEAYISIPGIDDGEYGQLYLQKNDTDNLNFVRTYASGTNQVFRQVVSSVTDLSVGDFVKVYAYQNSGGEQTGTDLNFSGFRIGS